MDLVPSDLMIKVSLALARISHQALLGVKRAHGFKKLTAMPTIVPGAGCRWCRCAGKGLPVGIGAFEGDVRLEFETDLIITPLAYVRTSDGFVTSVHDLAPSNDADRTWVSIVNPGSNRNQESLVRIINRTDEENGVEIWG